MGHSRKMSESTSYCLYKSKANEDEILLRRRTRNYVVSCSIEIINKTRGAPSVETSIFTCIVLGSERAFTKGAAGAVTRLLT